MTRRPTDLEPRPPRHPKIGTARCLECGLTLDQGAHVTTLQLAFGETNHELLALAGVGETANAGA